ncbi:hypothetical protein KOW79_004906 [Hemibagrus wyckioides]|uniref:Uncharacterized protein n=1 Tax=Hemibagrus wyckioides TaxID=337641 RepID=A0A9D3SNS1_9TELE|nr:hypothetical protein KOW79_004906 [Hemibagrus wyckioides]
MTTLHITWAPDVILTPVDGSRRSGRRRRREERRVPSSSAAWSSGSAALSDRASSHPFSRDHCPNAHMQVMPPHRLTANPTVKEKG